MKRSLLARLEDLSGGQRRDALTDLASDLDRAASGAGDRAKVTKLATAVRQLVNVR